MILPKKRDPRFITVRRGGTLQDSDHHLLAVWAADCAQHVLHLFEEMQPNDDRPRRAIELARAWTRGEITMSQARAAGGHAMAAARVLSGAARHAAFAAGQEYVVLGHNRVFYSQLVDYFPVFPEIFREHPIVGLYY